MGHDGSSRVPHHLGHFHRPSFTTYPFETPLSAWHSSISTSSYPPELCPLHWRSSSRSSLGKKLKKIVNKDRARRQPRQRTRVSPILKRPTMKRMKDSDDYITARAANPRTGLISPSVGTRTPDSPAEALRMVESPTPVDKMKRRGIKAQGESTTRWCTKEDGWHSDPVPVAQTPEISRIAIQDDERMASCSAGRRLGGDELIVTTPSAREPQPGSVLDWTGFDTGQQKSDIHREGCARGFSPAAVPDTSKTSHPVKSGILQLRSADARYEKLNPLPQLPRIQVRKREHNRVEGISSPCLGGAQPNAATAPSSASHQASSTTKRGCLEDEGQESQMQCLRSLIDTNFRGTTTTAKSSSVSAGVQDREIVRKPVGSAPRAAASGVANSSMPSAAKGDQYTKTPTRMTSSSQQEAHVFQANHLTQLPRVRLARPERRGFSHGGQPATAAAIQQVTDRGERHCSLGCRKEASNGECLERRKVSSQTSPQQFRLLEGRQLTTAYMSERDAGKWDLLFELLLCVQNHIKNIQLPRLRTLQALWAPHASPQDQIEALKALSWLSLHAVVIFAAVITLWKLSAAVLQVFATLFWPLLIPLKILKWLIRD